METDSLPRHHGVVTSHPVSFYHCVTSHLLEPFLPSPPLKLHSEVVPTARFPANQNTLTKQPSNLSMHATTIRARYAKCLPCSLNHSPVSFLHYRESDLTSLCTPLPSYFGTDQRAPLKFPRYIPQWQVLYVFC